jgi:RNA polymerase sigma-70 factor (ECF subfamily)
MTTYPYPANPQPVGAPANPDTDTQLMIRVQRGESESFSHLLHRNRSIVVRNLSRVIRNEAIAEELAQDVFIRIYRSRAAYEPKAKFSTWLFRITTNVALNYFRDEKKSRHNLSLDDPDGAHVRRRVADRAPSPEDLLVRDAVATQIRRAIRTLPPRQRAVIVMHKYEEMEYSEIAVALGCSVLAVKSLMFRACETLRLRVLRSGRA